MVFYFFLDQHPYRQVFRPLFFAHKSFLFHNIDVGVLTALNFSISVRQKLVYTSITPKLKHVSKLFCQTLFKFIVSIEAA